MDRPRFAVWQLMLLVAVIAMELALIPKPLVVLVSGAALVVPILVSRKRHRAFYISSGFGLLALLVLVANQYVAVWDGSRPVTLTAYVSDSCTNRPIPGATFRVWVAHQAFASGSTTSWTDPSGKAFLKCVLATSGREGSFVRHGLVHFVGAVIEISAKGCLTMRAPLELFTGRSRDIRNPTPPPIRIALDPTPGETRGPLASLAGQYCATDPEDWSWSNLAVSADGRFLFAYRDGSGVVERVQGTAILNSGRLTLMATNSTPRLPQVLVHVPWGRRAYLVPLSQITRFVERRELLESSSDGPPHFPGPIFLREGDWEKPVEGEPDVSDKFNHNKEH